MAGVNPLERRAQVAEAAADLIAERGVAAVTFRDLAKRLKCSTTGITHYFASRQDVLLETYRFVAARALERRRRIKRPDTIAQLIGGMMPLGDDEWRDWRVWLCLWTEALFNAELAELHRDHARGRQQIVEELLVSLGCPPRKAAEAATRVMVAIYGIAVQSAFDREQWPAERQRKVLRDLLAFVETEYL